MTTLRIAFAALALSALGCNESPAECAARCRAEQGPGYTAFMDLASSCACKHCIPACVDKVCAQRKDPTEDCATCVRQSIDSVCNLDATFKAQCTGACGTFLACVQDCPWTP